MTAKERAECLVFNHDLAPMLNPSEDGKEAAVRLITEAIDAAVKEATEDVCLGYAKLTKDHHSLLLLARELAEHLITDKGFSCKVCYPNETGVVVGHKDGCPVKRLEAFK